jgi:hypothetical protein
MSRGGAQRKPTTRERAAELQAASAPAPVSIETPEADDGPVDLLAEFRSVATDRSASPRQRLIALEQVERLQGGTLGHVDLQPGMTCPACGTHRDTPQERETKVAALLPSLFQPSTDPRPLVEIAAEEQQAYWLERGFRWHIQIEPVEGISAPVPAAEYVKPHRPFAYVADEDEHAAFDAFDRAPAEPVDEATIAPEQTAAERLLGIEEKLARGEALTKDEGAEYLSARGQA